MPESYSRFLVVRLSSIGDIVHALPAVAALGRRFPQAIIHWAVEKRYASLLKGNPYLRRIIELDTLGWRNRLTSADTFDDILQSFRVLRESPYDVAIDMQGLLKTGLLMWASQARERLGFQSQWLREPAAAMFYTRRISAQGRQHIIEINLSLVEHLGAQPGKWEFPLPSDPEDELAVREQLQALGTTEYIIVNPGGGWKAKRWSPENYAEAIRRLAGELPFNILLTGSEQERDLIHTILEQAQAPRTKWFPATLCQFIALARGARLLIGGDTGPLHLAAGAGTPLVAIFNSSDPTNTPERNGPFNPADIVLCGAQEPHGSEYAKNLDYLPGVSVDSVVQAACERLKRANG